MNIAIDSGNTTIKLGFFENGRLIKLIEHISYSDLVRLLISDYQEQNIIVSSVKEEKSNIVKDLASVKNLIVLDSKTKLPLQNLYETPETLGLDRIAAVVGAKWLFPDENCLVIDAGTAITYDFIDKENNYYGGGISPGINLRFKSLNNYTARLPLVKEKEPFELIGKNTEEAIRAGVMNGVVAELNGIIALYLEKDPMLRLFICGGDAKFFESKIKESIFVVPELVLIGLNRILEYNNAFQN